MTVRRDRKCESSCFLQFLCVKCNLTKDPIRRKFFGEFDRVKLFVPSYEPFRIVNDDNYIRKPKWLWTDGID